MADRPTGAPRFVPFAYGAPGAMEDPGDDHIVATFTTREDADRYGPLWEAAPATAAERDRLKAANAALLAALRQYVALDDEEQSDARADAIAAIAKAGA